MNKYLSVKGAPQEYICSVGCWEVLEEHLTERKLKKVLVLRGEKSWAVAEKHFPVVSSNVELVFADYGHQCSDNNRDKFVAFILENQIDSIIAVGGGKVSDLAKAIGYKAKLPVIMMPTLASTCAAYTPLSVMYDDTGRMDRLDYYNRSIALTLVDPLIILDSPVEYLVAGIGDTLAKWYEADTIIRHLETKPVEVEVAHFAARKCKEYLLEKSAEAIEAIETQKLNQAFIDIVETNLLLAGMVGGFGDEYGRTAGAHTLFDALTSIPESQQQLHGNLVSYGILIQLIIEDRWQEIERLLPFYESLGLPTSLQAMNLELTIEDVDNIAQLVSAKDEPIHFMKEEITAEVVSEAIYALERFRN